MPTSTTRTTPVWLATLQIAIILAAIALTVMPQLRIPLIVQSFLALSFANCLMMVVGDWKTGLLSLTPRQLYERARTGEKFPRHTLGFAAIVATTIAQWHISMG